MIKNNQLWILILLLLVAKEGWSQGDQRVLVLSLKQAEQIAIQNNYMVNASLHSLEQGYYGFKASQAFFKPQVNFTSQYGFNNSEHSLDTALQMTQPLYNKVAFCQLKEAQIQWEMAKIDLQQQLCDILFAVREGYYSVLLHQAHLALDKNIIEIWENEVKKQERFLELGVSIPFELNQSRLHLKNAWRDYYDSQGEVKTSQIELLTVLGLAPNTPFILIDKDIPPPPIDWGKCNLEKWKQVATKYRPQLIKEQFSYLLSQNQVRQVKAERLPTVSFYINGGNQYVNNGFIGQPYAGTGLNLNWAIYDPTNKPRIKQAEEGRREAASNYNQVELETDAIIYALLNEIDKSYLAYRNAEEGSVLAEQGMQMAIRKNELGMMSPFEYRDTIDTLHESQQQVNQAKFDLYQAYNRLIHQTGFDLKQEK